MVNIREGGTIQLNSGKEVVIEPHSDRIHLSLWQNAAMIEVFLYSERQPENVESDRIHLVITDSDGERLGWLMNITDAVCIIAGLSKAIEEALNRGYPASD
jgi:hypothetical protein